MDHAARIAFINAQTACMLAEMYGMIAENKQREHRGESLAYVQEQFDNLAPRYGITHNQVIEYLAGY